MKSEEKGEVKKEVGVELKYCEHCGSLWVRERGAGVYCNSCQLKVADLPAGKQKPSRIVLPAAEYGGEFGHQIGRRRESLVRGAGGDVAGAALAAIGQVGELLLLRLGGKADCGLNLVGEGLALGGWDRTRRPTPILVTSRPPSGSSVTTCGTSEFSNSTPP